MPVRAILLVAAALGAMVASGKPVQIKDVPAAVRKTIERELHGGTMQALSKDRIRGRTRYALETIVNGHTRDVLIDAVGRVIEIGEEVGVDALPHAVRKRFEARGTITKAEQVTRGSARSYAATVERRGHKAQMSVDPSGRVLRITRVKSRLS